MSQVVNAQTTGVHNNRTWVVVGVGPRGQYGRDDLGVVWTRSRNLLLALAKVDSWGVFQTKTMLSVDRPFETANEMMSRITIAIDEYRVVVPGVSLAYPSAACERILTLWEQDGVVKRPPVKLVRGIFATDYTYDRGILAKPSDFKMIVPEALEAWVAARRLVLADILGDA